MTINTSTSNAPSLFAKVSYANILRQFRLDDTTADWENFESQVRRIHNIPPTFPVVLTYKDEEGDLIAIDTTEELDELRRQAQRDGARSVRFTVSLRDSDVREFVVVGEQERNADTASQAGTENTGSIYPTVREDVSVAPPPPSSASDLPATTPEVDVNTAPTAPVVDAHTIAAAPEQSTKQIPTNRSTEKGKAAASDASPEAHAGPSGTSSTPTEEADNNTPIDPLSAFFAGIGPIFEEMQSQVAAHPEFFEKMNELAGQVGAQAQTHLKPFLENLVNQFQNQDFYGSQSSRGPHGHRASGQHCGGRGGWGNPYWRGPGCHRGGAFGGPFGGSPFGFPFDGPSGHGPHGCAPPPPPPSPPHRPEHGPHHRPRHHHPRHPAFETTNPGPLWPHVTCDGCEKPLAGTRYKCQSCADYDLCDGCHSRVAEIHESGSHQFEKKEHPWQKRWDRKAARWGGRHGGFGGPWGAWWANVGASSDEETAPLNREQEEEAPPATPDSGLEEKNEWLKSMGFYDETENAELLRRYDGNVERVVEVLLQRQ